ncbi:MAG: hypothetical protein AB7T49_07175 [Oligoflexales bacterium]
MRSLLSFALSAALATSLASCKKAHPSSPRKTDAGVNERRGSYLPPKNVDPELLRTIGKEEAASICKVMPSLQEICESSPKDPLFRQDTQLTTNGILHCLQFKNGQHIMLCLELLKNVPVSKDRLANCRGLNDAHLNCLIDASDTEYKRS